MKGNVLNELSLKCWAIHTCISTCIINIMLKAFPISCILEFPQSNPINALLLCPIFSHLFHVSKHIIDPRTLQALCEKVYKSFSWYLHLLNWHLTMAWVAQYTCLVNEHFSIDEGFNIKKTRSNQAEDGWIHTVFVLHWCWDQLLSNN